MEDLPFRAAGVLTFLPYYEELVILISHPAGDCNRKLAVPVTSQPEGRGGRIGGYRIQGSIRRRIVRISLFFTLLKNIPLFG
jgi:hypothetical protein